MNEYCTRFLQNFRQCMRDEINTFPYSSGYWHPFFVCTPNTQSGAEWMAQAKFDYNYTRNTVFGIGIFTFFITETYTE